MSALGQKQTFALHQPMSRFTPKSGHEMAICDLWNLNVCYGAKNVRFTPESGPTSHWSPPIIALLGSNALRVGFALAGFLGVTRANN
jgi:hypothetical protein